MQLITSNVKAYTPPLLLDQFGKYVVQCCLRLSSQRNQFIFDAMVDRCLDIAQGRFGARAMRACLESQHVTKKQQVRYLLYGLDKPFILGSNIILFFVYYRNK